MIAGPLGSVTSVVVQSWITDALPESPTLDFKQTEYGRRDDQRTEFLKDVCAFANGNGGDIVMGVATVNDVAAAVAPISSEPADALMRRLQGWLDSEVQPRLTVQMHPVEMAPDRYILLVKVPASFVGPHRFRVHGASIPDHHRFVIRSGTRTSEMDYGQLRDAFERNSRLLDQARSFRRVRVEGIQGADLPVPMTVGPKSVLHLVPLSTVGRYDAVGIAASFNSGLDLSLQNWSSTRSVNADGMLCRGGTGRDGNCPGYVQLFRTGAIEAVQIGDAQWLRDDQKIIPSHFVSKFYRNALTKVLDGAKQLGLSGPAIVGAALTHVTGYAFAKEQIGGGLYCSPVTTRAHLVLPEVLVEDLGAAIAVDEVARPMLDTLWQCFGEVECPLYAADGTFME